LYRLNGQALKLIHDWVKNYERFWSERFDRLEDVLEELKEEGDGGVPGHRIGALRARRAGPANPGKRVGR